MIVGEGLHNVARAGSTVIDVAHNVQIVNYKAVDELADSNDYFFGASDFYYCVDEFGVIVLFIYRILVFV